MKRFISIILVLSLLSCSFVASAAPAGEKQYRDYKVYTLLGDSVASGYDDVEKDSESCQFKYKEGGYGAKVAEALGVKLNSMACPAVRTVEIRYLLEDDYPADDYMFYGIAYNWQREGFKEEYRNAVREADLITLGIGGNDYLTYLVWVVLEEMEKTGLGVHKELANEIIRLINDEGINESTLNTIVDVASVIDALPELGQILPVAFVEALKRYYENWNYVIEDIYYYNEDVELYVIGGLNYGVILPGGDDASTLKYNIGKAVAELGNKPQIEGAEKYGYTFVSTVGTDCVLTHPTPDGYTHIANLILEALPDVNYSFGDAAHGTKYYESVYYMTQKGYMNGISDTEFGVDAKITAAELAQTLYNIDGQAEGDACAWAKENGIIDKEPESEVGCFELISALNAFSGKQGRTDIFFKLNFLIFALKNIFSTVIFGSLTRGNAAKMIYDYCKQI